MTVTILSFSYKRGLPEESVLENDHNEFRDVILAEVMRRNLGLTKVY